MNHKFILVYDFETDSVDPLTTSPVELACVPIHPRTLEILTKQSFNISIRPPDIDDKNYFENHQSTIMWHSKNHNVQPEAMVKKWKEGIDQKVSWQEFSRYCKELTIEKRPGVYHPEPIPAGYNILNFDNIIANRLSTAYKIPLPFSSFNQLDLLPWLWTWMENLSEPHNMKMDTLRSFFKIPQEGQAHEALVDVIDTAKIIVRFLQFQRRQASVDKFKGTMAK